MYLTLTLTTASNTAVGAVLQLYVDSTWHPISLSKKMKPAKTCYSMFHHELLALYLAIRHFYRPQAAHLCPTGSSRPTLSLPGLTVGFHFSIYIKYPTHPWLRERGCRCPLMHREHLSQQPPTSFGLDSNG